MTPKTALFAALLMVWPVAAVAQTAPLLLNPADANKDGVVTDDERADYLAKKAAGVQDQPGLPVAPPKANGQSTFILGETPETEAARTAAGDPPEHASDWEKQAEEKVRREARDD